METSKSRDYTQYALLQNNHYKLTIPLTTIITFISMIVIEHFSHSEFEFQQWEMQQVQLYAEMIPVMLLTFLSGYSVGSLVVLMFFTYSSMHGGLALQCFMLLLASVFMNIPIYRRWFLSFPKTLLADLILVILLGPGWNMLLTVLSGMDAPIPEDRSVLVFNFLFAVPSCTFVCLLCYCFHKFLPQKTKNLFFATAAASDFVVEFRKRIKGQKRPKISAKINGMIIAVAITMMIAAYGISINLFSDEVNHLSKVAEETSINLDRGMQDWSSWRTIVFATRLVVLMTIVAVPAILFAISSTNSMVTNPLILMALALEDNAIMEFGKGNVDIRKLGIKSRDEIGILYGAILHSCDVLDEFMEKVEAEKKLTNDLAVAKEANKAKDIFLSSMSHEIRTPINAVLGLDEMIIRETHEDEIRNYALDIQTAGKNLLSLINEILDFSKIEAGRMEIIPVEYDISSTINDLLNMISKRAEDKGLELKLEVDSTIPHLLEGDEIRIKQCVINILTNAVKYTERGSVTMTVGWEKCITNSEGGNKSDRIALTFHVIDTGIGIKEEDLPKLFTAFKRIEEKRNRTIEGTGLGMNIVQNLLALMGSELEVKSVYGKGSDFYFTVEQKVVDWSAVGDWSHRGSYGSSSGAVLGSSAAASMRETFHAPNARVLIVDDTRLNLTVARGLLKQTLVQIDTAESGAETLELVKQKKYDVIFLDHRMPNMDGIETLVAMKTLDGNINLETPCIALTANAIAGAREMYIQSGFTDYLTKPIDSSKLERMLVEYLPADKVEMIDSAAKNKPVEITSTLSPVNGIDFSAALTNCGSQEILLDAIKEFYNTIDQKADSIESYTASHDWKNYTILVHALKSSARLIGADELSSQAAYLEHCGDTANETEITEKTPELLTLYRSYKEKLVQFATPVQSHKTPISKNDYSEAISNLKECIQAFDFNTADQIIRMLDDYIIPNEEAERFNQIKQKVSAVDQAEVLRLLS